jgi:hypothetical protein
VTLSLFPVLRGEGRERGAVRPKNKRRYLPFASTMPLSLTLSPEYR